VNDVLRQMRSGKLWKRLTFPSLADRSVDLVLNDPNVTAADWARQSTPQISEIDSILSVDLSGCSELLNIPSDLFEKCHFLERVVFNDNTRTLGECCFHKCRALKSVTLPKSLSVIHKAAFSECKSLVSVK